MIHLLLTVRFLDDRYHGLLGRGGPPEWPPSPFRLFQALVAGVAQRGELDTAVGKSLEWLQTLDPPIIIAPKSKTGQAITRFVPNNDGDKKFDRQERLTAKPTIPTLMLLDPDQKPEVHYVWDISDHADAPIDRIRDAARSLTTLGWGIDMAFADADRADEAKLQTLKGIRWHPKPGVWRDDGMLRTPTVDQETKLCSLCDLRHCHETAMNRIEHGKPLHTVDKPRVFERVFYSSTERPIGRPVAVFKLVDKNEDAFRYPHAKLIHIAGMVRHLAIEAMEKSPPDEIEKLGEEACKAWIDSYVAGHVRDGEAKHRQFSYLPLPSIGHRHTDPSVRRVMIAAPLGDDQFLRHLAQRLNGEQLKPTPQTRLEHPPTLVQVQYDKVASFYTQPANTWASVTPVILPGYDDRKPEKTCKLIQRALAQSGIEQECEFEWSAFSRFPKLLSAHNYVRNKRPIGYIRPGYLLSQTAVHLQIRFGRREIPGDPQSRWIPSESQIPGPLAIGAGRHCGLGVFAAEVP